MKGKRVMYVVEQYNCYTSGVCLTFKEAKRLVTENKCGIITKLEIIGDNQKDLKRWAYLATGELVEVPLFNPKKVLK